MEIIETATKGDRGYRAVQACCLVATVFMLTGCPSASMPTTPSTPSLPTPPSVSLPSGSSSSSPSSSSDPTDSRSSSSSSSSGSPSNSAGTSSASMPSGSGPSPSAGSANLPSTSTKSAGMPSAGDASGSVSTADSGDNSAPTTGDSTAQRGSEPGFGDSEGVEALPDMRDTLPTFEDSYGQNSTVAGDPNGTEAGGYDGEVSGGSHADASQNVGARAEGGLGGRASDNAETGFEESQGPLTSAEQVAVLDRQLEQSTSDFDALILEEQQRQREMDRARPERIPQTQTEPANSGSSGRNPYENDVAMGGGRTSSGMGGGISRASTGAPDNPAIYKAPDDIPDGDNDDVVARQLREAAMREPNPAVRERLWNEYRKYTGLEIPNP